MAFWNREELPPELKDKTPAEIAAALKKAGELETAVAAEKTAREAAEAANATQLTEVDKMRTRIAELEANATPPPPPVVDEPPSPWTDPEKFVAKQTEGVANTALAAGLMAAKMYFMQNISARDLKIFKKYEKEVEQGVASFVPSQRVMPQSWLNIFLYVKGVHEQDIRKAEADDSDFFSETPSRGVTQEPPPQDKLTAEEEEV